MSFTWESHDRPQRAPIGVTGWLRIVLRGLAIVVFLAGCVVVSAATRLVERPVHRQARPWSAPITSFAMGGVLRLTGLALRVEGKPMRYPGAVVANHVSWLDILALHDCQRVVFVSKAEVAGWPGIGFLARFAGTVFIARDPRAARAQRDTLVEAMDHGARLMLFPEGTSTDGMRVLPFKSTLFEMMFASDRAAELYVQPVSVIYEPPEDEPDPRIYGWWGDMDLGPHLLSVLARGRQGIVRVVFHAPLAVRDFAGRKALAQAAEEAVRQGLPERRRARA